MMMFEVRSAAVPTIEALVGALLQRGIQDVRFADEGALPLADETLPVGLSIAYRDLVSTRPLLIERDVSRTTIRMQSGACAPTCLLGAALAAELANHAGTDVLLEDGSSIAPADCFSRFDAAWAESYAHSTLDGLFDFVRRATDEGVRVGILRHDYRMTRPFLARFSSEPNLHDIIHRSMRRLNFLSSTDEDVYVPNLIAGALKNGFRGRFSTYHGGRSLVSLEAEAFGVPLDHAVLDRDAVLEALGASVEWLSADYVILPKIDEAQMVSLVRDVARIVAARPTAASRPSGNDAARPSAELNAFVEEAIARGLEAAMHPDVMVPIALVRGPEGTRLLVLMADDMPGALRMLDESIKGAGVDVFAFMYEGTVRGEGSDALVIEAGERSASAGFRYAQRFDKAAQQLIGSPELVEQLGSRFRKRNIFVSNMIALGCLTLLIGSCCFCGFSKILINQATQRQGASPSDVSQPR